MTISTDPTLGVLRRAVEDAQARYDRARASLTPKAAEFMMERRARGPFGMRPEPTPEEQEARRVVREFTEADAVLVSAKVALNRYRRGQARGR